MFSKELERYVAEVWKSADIRPVISCLSDASAATCPADAPVISCLSDDEVLLLTLLYGTLPDSDTASVCPDVLLGFVRHALFLRKNSPFCHDLPEDLFLHFVFYPRINSENLEDCRAFFYRELWDTVKELPAEEAVLEVNRWCCAHMTYRASNDRTESPMTAYRSGDGRCGEESVFAVTALRSIGIPARQIYVPFWSHCDDNHAWVEAYVDGQWRFFGACEPEPVLDRGWFNGAASRAPVACFRTFFDFGSETAADSCIQSQGTCRLYNVISRYAVSRRLDIYVEEPSGKASKDTKVRLSVVNMAAFRTIAELKTDANGKCSLLCGCATVHIEACDGDCRAETDHTVSENGVNEVRLTLKPFGSAICVQSVYEPDFFAPPPGPITPPPGPITPPQSSIAPPSNPIRSCILTPEQQRANAAVLAQCARERNKRIAARYREEWNALDSDWQQILHLAGANAEKLYAYIHWLSDPEHKTHPETRPGTCPETWPEARPEARLEICKDLLRSIETKDFKDIEPEVLEDHLKGALPFRKEPHFVKEILSPRIGTEMLEPWRELIQSRFTEEQKKRFHEDPPALMDHISAYFSKPAKKQYPLLSFTPSAMLKYGISDENGQALLFVAVMRTLGVPARLNPISEYPEYYRDGTYHTAFRNRMPENAVIRLIPETGKRFVYAADYTLSFRQPDGEYRILNAPQNESRPEFPAQPGCYRLLSTGRLPNGNQLVRVTDIAVNADETVSVPLQTRQAEPEQMLGKGSTDPFTVYDEEGKSVSSSDIVSGLTAVIWLDAAKEPSQHILNELAAASEAIREKSNNGAPLCLVLVLRDKQDLNDPALQRAVSMLPGTPVYYEDAPSAALLARQLFLEPEIRPLLLLTDKTGRGFYGACGYQTGTVELLLKLAVAAEKYIL